MAEPSFFQKQASYGSPANAPYVPFPIDYAIQAGIGKTAIDEPIPIDNKSGVSIKRAPFDEQTAQALESRYRNFIDSAFENYKKTGDVSNLSRTMGIGKQDFKSSQLIQTVTRNVANYEDYLKKKQEADPRDIDFTIGNPDNPYTAEAQLQPGQTWTPRRTEYSDPVKDQASTISNIAESSWKQQGYNFDETGQLVKKSGSKVEQISPERVFTDVTANTRNYANTKGGIWSLRNHIINIGNELGIPIDPTDYNIDNLHLLDQQLQGTPADRTYRRTVLGLEKGKLVQKEKDLTLSEIIKEELKEELYANAQKQIFRKTEEDADLSFAPGYKDLIERKQIPFTSQTGPTEGTGDWRDVFGIEDPKMSLKGYSPANTGVGVGTGIGTSPGSPVKTKEVEKQKAIEEAQKITTIAKNLGLLVETGDPNRPIDYEATKQNVIDYGNNIATMSKITVDLSGTAPSTNLTNTFFGPKANISNMTFMEQGKPETKTELSTAENKDRFRNSQVVGLDYTAEQPGAMVLAVSNEDLKEEYGDKPYIAVTKNLDLQRAMKPVQQLTTQALNFAKSGTGNQQALEAVNELNKQGFQTQGLGVPASVSYDNKSKKYFLSFLQSINNTPNISTMIINSDGTTEMQSLEELQEKNTSYIFNEVLPQYGRKEIVPKTPYEE